MVWLWDKMGALNRDISFNKGVFMSGIDELREIARRVLIIATPAGGSDKWLWDRTQRILRNVEQICRLPELVVGDIPVDRFCLTAATYFADTGFSHYVEAGSVPANLVLSDVNSADLRKFSAQIVAGKLGDIITGSKIDKISRIITESANRETDMAEAGILSDATNLDDVGAVGVFNEFRRFAIQGRGVSEVLDSWKKKVDYRYWQARLKEGFHYEAVRKLAFQRFAATEYFMNQLKIEHFSQDMDDVLIESLETIPEGSV